MIEALVFWTLATWFAFYLVNHATLFGRVRAAVFPALPTWLANSLQCAFCMSFWILAVFTLFVGATPMILLCPPCTLMWEMLFLRLKGQPPLS